MLGLGVYYFVLIPLWIHGWNSHCGSALHASYTPLLGVSNTQYLTSQICIVSFRVPIDLLYLLVNRSFEIGVIKLKKSKSPKIKCDFPDVDRMYIKMSRYNVS